jgi:hypothetical protein
VTPVGWQAAHDDGLRTVVDLRNPDEIYPDTGGRATALAGSGQFAPAAGGPGGLVAAAGIDRIEVALDDIEDTSLWRQINADGLNGTPLYYPPFLEHKAARCAEVITAIAVAKPGSVLFHCAGGRDRTGLISLLLLDVAEVEPEVIADDYEQSTRPLAALRARMGLPDDGPAAAEALAAHGTTARAAILAVLQRWRARDYLREGGVRAEHLAAIRQRLRG